METDKYKMRVEKVRKSYTQAGKTVNEGSIHASGQVLCLPKTAFVDGADWQQIFRRWLNCTARCETSPVRHANHQYPESIFRTSKIQEERVCATLLGGSMDVNGDYVTLTTNVVPYGPYGDKLATYMREQQELIIVPRFILDKDGKITGVPAWDLDLPSGWDIVPYEYNDVQDEVFVGELAYLIEKCKAHSLNWAMHYSDTDDLWRFTLSTYHAVVCFDGDWKKLCDAVEDATAYFDGLDNHG
ncbi:hypothetical protein pEaSNUABM6_00135 [Erwinia phage pEa_SNUABM_6]|nr:hypothetical protein pEaSNUABM6_00135 [Erwinia phage pEa_SNUABM_6]